MAIVACVLGTPGRANPLCYHLPNLKAHGHLNAINTLVTEKLLLRPSRSCIKLLCGVCCWFGLHVAHHDSKYNTQLSSQRKLR